MYYLPFQNIPRLWKVNVLYALPKHSEKIVVSQTHLAEAKGIFHIKLCHEIDFTITSNKGRTSVEGCIILYVLFFGYEVTERGTI